VYTRLRAIIVNGVAWGSAWFLSIVVMATIANAIDGHGLRLGGLELAVPGSILFGAAGIAAATAMSFLLRGRALANLHWARFGLGGGAVTFVFLPMLLSVLRAVNGDALLPASKLLGTGALGFAFGSVVAAGTLVIAQWSDRRALVTRAARSQHLPATEGSAHREADTSQSKAGAGHIS
jgi:hypothetical protein